MSCNTIYALCKETKNHLVKELNDFSCVELEDDLHYALSEACNYIKEWHPEILLDDRKYEVLFDYFESTNQLYNIVYEGLPIKEILKFKHEFIESMLIKFSP
jgi:hypothetical protein